MPVPGADKRKFGEVHELTNPASSWVRRDQLGDPVIFDTGDHPNGPALPDPNFVGYLNRAVVAHVSIEPVIGAAVKR